jgi:hypothetical protein
MLSVSISITLNALGLLSIACGLSGTLISIFVGKKISNIEKEINPHVALLKFNSILKPLSYDDKIKVERHDRYLYPKLKKLRFLFRLGILLIVVAAILGVINNIDIKIDG